METACESPHVRERAVELVCGRRDPVLGQPLVPLVDDAAQGVGHAFEPLLRSLAQTPLETPALIVLGRKDPPARGGELGHLAPQLHLEPGVRSRELRRGRHGLEQRGVVQLSPVVDEGGDGLVPALDDRHPAFRAFVGERQGSSFGIEEGVRRGVPSTQPPAKGRRGPARARRRWSRSPSHRAPRRDR